MRAATRESPMTRRASIAAITSLAIIGTAALAETSDKPAGAEEGGRYSFHRAGDRFVRLDSQTGAVAQCGWSATGWACNVVPDERAALDSEIERLRKENAELKKSLLAYGVDLPSAAKPDASGSKDAPRQPDSAQLPKLPSEAELDRAVTFMKNVWRRLVELMADLQRDVQRKT
jgi:hypothetical protein